MSEVALFRRAVLTVAVALVAAGLGGWLTVSSTTTSAPRQGTGAPTTPAPMTTAPDASASTDATAVATTRAAASTTLAPAAPTTSPAVTPTAAEAAPASSQSAPPHPSRNLPATGIYGDQLALVGLLLLLTGSAAVWIEERTRLTRLVAVLLAGAGAEPARRRRSPAHRIQRRRGRRPGPL